jgi:hypothetical protein
MDEQSRPPRTYLAWRLEQYGQAVSDFVDEFNRMSADRHTGGSRWVTINARTARRWLTGANRPEPLARKVLEAMYGTRVEELLAPFDGAEATTAEPSPGSHPTTPPPQHRGARYHDIEEATSMAADESARFVQRAEETNVGPHTLEGFRIDLEHDAEIYPNRPVYPMFCQFLAQRDRLFTLLEGRQPPARTRDLYMLAAAYGAALATASFDLGNFRAGQMQARAAFAFAELAGHNGLRAWLRGTQALIAYWDGRPRKAIEYCQLGTTYLPESGTAAVRLAAIEARACGRLGDEAGVEAALRRADTARDNLRGPDNPAGMLAFPLAKSHLYAGTARLLLGGTTNARRAQSDAEIAVTLYDTEPEGRRRLGEIALARVDLATTMLTTQDYTDATTHLEAALDIVGNRSTDIISRRLAEMGRTLTLTRRTSATANLLEMIVAATTRRSVPQLEGSEQ